MTTKFQKVKNVQTLGYHNMANAMLEDEHFKSSHQDLTIAFNSIQGGKVDLNRFGNNNSNHNTNMVDHKNNQHHHHVVDSSTCSSSNHSPTMLLKTKKSVEFFLQTEPDSKRCKPSARWTAKQVVDGMFCLFVFHTANMSLIFFSPSFTVSHTTSVSLSHWLLLDPSIAPCKIAFPTRCSTTTNTYSH
jgi:hypothetical protein